jgi:transcriptional regulator GlxA family with amidase domain
MHISIVMFDSCTPLLSIGAQDLFTKSEQVFRQIRPDHADDAPSEIILVSAEADRTVRAANGLSVECALRWNEVDSTDLVVIPAIDGDILVQLADHDYLVPWIRNLFERGADVASICTGSFLVADAGLLDGKSAATHWLAHALFEDRYPHVKLLPDRIVVDQGRVITSGGATSFMNLVMYLVEKYWGAETSRYAAKLFLIDINKGSQNAYAIFSGQKSHGDVDILKAQRIIEENVSEPIPVIELAERVAISPRHFIRRFKNATGNTPIEYVQRVRIESAKQALEATSDSVSEVASNSGYADVPSFRRLFKKITGTTPAEYRNRYRLVS